MLLVPRQLMRSGMTGATPYYGGRFTPAQAYSASHRAAAPPTPPPTGRTPLPAPATSRPETSRPETPRPDTEAALRHLRDTGVITAAEYDDLASRSHA